MRFLFPLLALPFLVAFSFSPMSQSIELGDGQKQVQFIVENPTGEPMAVEIGLRDRIQKEDGSEDQPASKDIAAFPPQLIIPPKEKRTVRVSFMGSKPTTEKAYRVVAEQLPVDVNGVRQKGSGIKMLLKYVAALYVNPGNTKADLKVVSIQVGSELKITLENKGSLHAPLVNPQLTLKKGSKKILLKDGQLKGLAGENVLAGARRVFSIPAVSGVDATFEGSIKVD